MAESKSSGGIGFLGLLAIVLITLKLCGVIDWYWWWVLFPLWIPLAALLAAMFVFLLAAALDAKQLATQR